MRCDYCHCVRSSKQIIPLYGGYYCSVSHARIHNRIPEFHPDDLEKPIKTTQAEEA